MQNASPIFSVLNDPAANDQSLSQVLLESAAKILKPLVRLWITHGVTYQMASELLKRVYIETAREHFVEEDASGTRLSLLTGINRKEIKRLLQEDEVSPESDGITSFASAVHDMWRTAKRYRGRDGTPKTLFRRAAGQELSFDNLVRSITTDHRPSALLHELSRLGVIEIISATNALGEQIRLTPNAFLPRRTVIDRIQQVTATMQDQNAAAVANALSDEPIFLERYVAADQLSEASAQMLHQHARLMWQKVHDDMVAQAIDCEADDAKIGDVAISDKTKNPIKLNTRIRVGMYFYSETDKNI